MEATARIMRRAIVSFNDLKKRHTGCDWCRTSVILRKPLNECESGYGNSRIRANSHQPSAKTMKKRGIKLRVECPVGRD